MFSSPWTRIPKFPGVSDIDYDDYWEHRGWSINSTLKIREKMILEVIPAGAKVLDIGCGNSRLPVELKEKGAVVTVADVSTKVLEGYAKFGIPSFVLNLEKISESSIGESYDFIIMSEVLEHITNPEAVIAILSPRTSQFLLTVPNSAAYMFRYGLLFRGRFFTQWVYHPSEHLRFWSHIDFLDWLQAQKLIVKNVKVTEGFSFRGRFPKLPYLWKNLLGFRMLYQCETDTKSISNNL